MGVIHVMNTDLVGRIAAGEVVERPASVVKELLENSIDAGATQVRINIEQGGQKLIQVIDDGCGMDRQDALLCLETHATSKITTTGDVGQIVTLGFRGEAIPSIASISRFSMQTRRQGDDAGTELFVDFGSIRDVRDCGCAPGTNIRVSQLFANLPARRKFLRGPDTEDGYIEEMVRNIALARPEITIALSLNGREALRTQGTCDIARRISSVLGKEAFLAMLPLEYSEDGVTVRGFVSKPGYTRSTRREQRVIVNGRTASAETVYFAIRDAFDQLVLRGRYPAAVIYVNLPADRVDVNVHPTKREVRFREPREVGQIIAAAIRRALRGLPGGEEGRPLAAETAVAAAQPPAFPVPNAWSPVDPAAGNGRGFLPPSSAPLPSQENGSGTVPTAPQAVLPPSLSPSFPTPPLFPPVEQPLPLNLPPPPTPVEQARQKLAEEFILPPPEPTGQANLHDLRFLAKLGKNYALAETSAGLVAVSLQAAHQRVVFERLLHSLKQKPETQPLLIPTTLTLSPEDARFLRQQREHFDKIGFLVEPFGGNSYVITAIPAFFPDTDLAQCLRDILDDLRHSPVTNRQSTIHLAQVASRHAMTKRQETTTEEIQTLIGELAKAEMPYTDPWGHPTMVLFSYQELERRFR